MGGDYGIAAERWPTLPIGEIRNKGGGLAPLSSLSMPNCWRGEVMRYPPFENRKGWGSLSLEVHKK